MAGNKSGYDAQVIVQLGFDAQITRNAEVLRDYGIQNGIPSAIVQIHPSAEFGVTFRYADIRALTSAFKNLTTNSRVYLQAHGDWQGQRLDQYDATQIGLLLASAKMPAVKILSVLGCEMGRDLGTANDCRVSNSVNSFASQLQVELKNRGIAVDIYARTAIIDFYSDIWSNEVDKYGRKGTFDDYDQFEAGSFQKRTRSKLLFTWENGQQARYYAY